MELRPWSCKPRLAKNLSYILVRNVSFVFRIRLPSRMNVLYCCRYQHPDFEQFGSLRVINEDRVEPQTGFGTHGHREFEIFSYVVDGELEQ